MPPQRRRSSSLTSSTTEADRNLLLHDIYNPFGLFPSKPVLVHQRNSLTQNAFLSTPLFGPLLFDNNDSDARDHFAAERTFLSWLRLASYMAIVSVAILISFHLKHQASPLEKQIALPLGVVFWVLAIACLGSGLSNYIKTVNRYSRRQAVVQSGWGTQVVFTVVASAIIAACVLFLSLEAKRNPETKTRS